MSESKSLITLARRFNNVNLLELQSKGYLPFKFEETRIGTISPAVLEEMNPHPDIFTITRDCVRLHQDLKCYEERSEELRKFMEKMRDKKLFAALDGWRDECYETRLKFGDPPIFKVERAGTPILGLRQYGVHINGFVKTSEKGRSIWIQRRSRSKQTYPGKLDTFVGGGFAEGFGVLQTAIKELEEEAGLVLPAHLKLKPCGSVSFFNISDRGLHPQTEFVYDLELPLDFQPENKDGEVDGFELVRSDQLIDLIQTEDYKTTSVPVALDWLVRHGFLSSETEPYLPELIEELHTPLHIFYN